MNSFIPELDADSVKMMIENSRQSKEHRFFDISFSNVKNNGTLVELLEYLTLLKRSNKNNRVDHKYVQKR